MDIWLQRIFQSLYIEICKHSCYIIGLKRISTTFRPALYECAWLLLPAHGWLGGTNEHRAREF